ncbi:MAG TPA: META domain-containing protein [Candidatus Limnocylindrales bacterium]|nr:META domain-containing protein [Candidatus Limnocylindrales bacterium]
MEPRQGDVTRFLPTALALGLLTLACAATAPGGSLDGREFLSTSVTEGGVIRQLVPGTRISLRFDDDQIGASAGCNIMGGTYRLDGGRLLVEGGAMTEMGCDEARSAQDNWLFGFLGSDPAARLTGNELVLTSGGTVVTLLDREVAVPDLPLVGPIWTVESIVAGDAVSSVPQGVVANVTFTHDGRFTVATGCNTGGGDVVVGGDTLQFGDVALTEMACQGDAAAMEAAVLAVLSADPVGYSIDADLLDLRGGASGLQLRGT